jgi:hypothetical protein
MNTIMSGTGRDAERHRATGASSESPRLADEAFGDDAVVGLPGVVTIRVPGGSAPGEVRLYVRGTYENLIAYAVELLEVGRHVVVVASRGNRAVDVEYTTPGG